MVILHDSFGSFKPIGMYSAYSIRQKWLFFSDQFSSLHFQMSIVESWSFVDLKQFRVSASF